MRKSVIVARLLDAIYGIGNWVDELEEYGLDRKQMHYAYTQQQSLRGRHSRELRALRSKPTSARTRRKIRMIEDKLKGYIDKPNPNPKTLEIAKQQIKNLLAS